MAKNKITKEELESLQGIVGKLNQAASQLGNIEMQKHDLLHASAQLKGDLEEMQSALKETYGLVNINLQDGTYVAGEEN
jgi:predicted transcriptional regulator